MAKTNNQAITATIISTHHCIQINDVQIDIWYEFTHNLMQVFADGKCIIITHYNPSRLILSYTNIIDVATTYYLSYLRQTKLISNDTE